MWAIKNIKIHDAIDRIKLYTQRVQIDYVYRNSLAALIN